MKEMKTKSKKGKVWISIKIQDEDGIVKEINKEIDVREIENVSEAEPTALELEREVGKATMEAIIKKKKKWKLIYYWKRMLGLFGMGKSLYK